MNQTTPTKPSDKKPLSSKSGMLAVVSICLSAMGAVFMNIKHKETGDKVGDAVTSGVWTAFSTIASIPLALGGIICAVLAMLFIVLSIKKLNPLRLITGVLWTGISIWSIVIAIGVFETMSK